MCANEICKYKNMCASSKMCVQMKYVFRNGKYDMCAKENKSEINVCEINMCEINVCEIYVCEICVQIQMCVCCSVCCSGC